MRHKGKRSQEVGKLTCLAKGWEDLKAWGRPTYKRKEEGGRRKRKRRRRKVKEKEISSLTRTYLGNPKEESKEMPRF